MRPERCATGAATSTASLPSWDAVQAWKEADDQAAEAERCLYAAWHAYRCTGCAVPALLRLHATTARALARRRLAEAIAASKAAADGNA